MPLDMPREGICGVGRAALVKHGFRLHEAKPAFHVDRVLGSAPRQRWSMSVGFNHMTAGPWTRQGRGACRVRCALDGIDS